MNLVLVLSLLAACVVLMIVERSGVMRTTLDLHFKGDVKRETRWFAQYGQSACTPVAMLLVWDLDPRGLRVAVPVGVAVAVTAIVVMTLKRTIGRVRPGREQAGRFLGPTLKHANYRESFPSSHTACAVALSAMLAELYPQAQWTFWVLAAICAGLRYVLDAHWPSDVVAGFLVGYVIAEMTAGVAQILTPSSFPTFAFRLTS
jgi:membrane-associated phospholipid phosphatase